MDPGGRSQDDRAGRRFTDGRAHGVRPDIQWTAVILEVTRCDENVPEVMIVTFCRARRCWSRAMWCCHVELSCLTCAFLAVTPDDTRRHATA